MLMAFVVLSNGRWRVVLGLARELDENGNGDSRMACVLLPVQSSPARNIHLYPSGCECYLRSRGHILKLFGDYTRHYYHYFFSLRLSKEFWVFV